MTGTVHEAARRASGDVVTIAYDASTGAQLWREQYGVPGGDDRPTAIAVTPNGRTVLVSGQTEPSPSPRHDTDYVLIAYRAAAGTQRWVSTYDGGFHQPDSATAMAIAGDGSVVYQTGQSGGMDSSTFAAATVADAVSNGSQRWASRWSGRGLAAMTAITADPTDVFVTGWANVPPSSSTYDMTTLALDPTDGVVRWQQVRGGSTQFGRSVAVAPDGSQVLVGGTGLAGSNVAFVSIAYAAADGSQRWIHTYSPPNAVVAYRANVAFSSDGSTAYTAAGGDPTDPVEADDAANGTRLWTGRVPSYTKLPGIVGGPVLSPDGSEVVVTGTEDGGGFNVHWDVVAYSTS